MKHLLTFAVVALLACNNFVTAQIYDAPPSGDIGSFVDQDFPDFPDFSSFLVDDVEITETVTIGSVTTYFTFDSNADGIAWPADNGGTPFTAVLNLIPDDGALDTEDPFAGTAVDVMVEDVDADGDGFIAVTAMDLNIELTPGTYWVGLCPTIDFGLFGQEFHPNTTTITGSPSFFRNPGGGFALGTAWAQADVALGALSPFDIALTIEEGGATGCMFDLGDVNNDGVVDLLDVTPFVNALTTGMFICEADVNEDGVLDLLDVTPFVNILTGG